MQAFSLHHDGSDLTPFVKVAYTADATEASILALLLRSFCREREFQHQLLDQSIVIYRLSKYIIAQSSIWHFIGERLVEYWADRFEQSRFKFVSPHMMERNLDSLKTVKQEIRVKKLVVYMLDGLRVRLPEELRVINDWLRE